VDSIAEAAVEWQTWYLMMSAATNTVVLPGPGPSRCIAVSTVACLLPNITAPITPLGCHCDIARQFMSLGYNTLHMSK
jgi:hypothetical protein